MGKIRSKALFEYLEQCGALASGDPALIAEAKRRYRIEYKRNHKRSSIKKRELRPLFAESQYLALIQKAKSNGYKTPTAYLYELAIGLLDGRTTPLPFKEKLIDVLQKIALAHHAFHSVKAMSFMVTTEQLDQVEKLIKEAEEALTEYLYLK